ncbi:MAG: GTPase [Clostridium sp.]
MNLELELLSKLPIIDKELVLEIDSKLTLLKELNNKSLQESKVHIACLGTYNAGKSSLLNSIIEKSIFKTDCVPTTYDVDVFETDKAIYLDTPGLNANTEDNDTAFSGIKNSDIILFVCNIQNGGLTISESNFLKKIQDYINSDNPLDNIVFLLSNKHSVCSSDIDKIKNKFLDDIFQSLGDTPSEIFIYDAITYQNGINENQTVLIEESGMNSIKSTLSNIIENKYSTLEPDRIVQVESCRNSLQEYVDILIDKINPIINKTNLEIKHITQTKSKLTDMVKTCAEESNNILNSLTTSNSNPCSLFVFLDSFSCITNKKSKSELKSTLKSKVSNIHSKRTRYVNNEIDKAIDYYKYYTENSSRSYYGTTNEKVAQFTSKYINEFRGLNILLPSESLKNSMVTPNINSSDIYNIKAILSNDVVQNGQYYSVDYYTNLIDIDESEDYGNTGFFGRTKYLYSAYNTHAATDEMEKDINSNLQSNADSFWRLSILPIVTKYNQNITNNLSNFVGLVKDTALKFINENNPPSNEHIYKAFKPLENYISTNNLSK